MRPTGQGGSRAAIVFASRPLFGGAAGSGESEIRRWLIKRDLLETVVALPDQLFPNTGIGSYVWILSNRKESPRQGNVVLLDCRQRFATTRGKLDDKRKYITPEQIADFIRIYRAAVDGSTPSGGLATVIPAAELGYQRVTVDRPRLGDGAKPEADPHLRTFHELSLHQDVHQFLAEEIRPLTPDAWIDPDTIKIGYEIRPYHFFAIPLAVENVPLSEVVEFVSLARRADPDSPLLTMQHLEAAASEADLPRLGDSQRQSSAGLTSCAGGDIVGRPGTGESRPHGLRNVRSVASHDRAGLSGFPSVSYQERCARCGRGYRGAAGRVGGSAIEFRRIVVTRQRGYPGRKAASPALSFLVMANQKCASVRRRWRAGLGGTNARGFGVGMTYGR